VVTSTIVFENGGIREYDGGYDDWLRQRDPKPKQSAAAKQKSKTERRLQLAPGASVSQSKKLSYKEKQELAQLPGLIEQLEWEMATLHGRMASSDFYQQSGDEIAAEQQRLTELKTLIAKTYARWEKLE